MIEYLLSSELLLAPVSAPVPSHTDLTCATLSSLLQDLRGIITFPWTRDVPVTGSQPHVNPPSRPVRCELSRDCQLTMCPPPVSPLDVAHVEADPVPGLGDHSSDAAAAHLQGSGATAVQEPLGSAAHCSQLPHLRDRYSDHGRRYTAAHR